MNNYSELALGASLISFMTELIMRVTPKGFDRQRFAILCNFLVAMTLSITEGIFKSGIGIYESVIRGIILTMASTGVYDTAGRVIGGVKRNSVKE